MVLGLGNFGDRSKKMNAHDFESALKDVERCKLCSKPVADCICSDRGTVVQKIRTAEGENVKIGGNDVKIGGNDVKIKR